MYNKIQLINQCHVNSMVWTITNDKIVTIIIQYHKGYIRAHAPDFFCCALFILFMMTWDDTTPTWRYEVWWMATALWHRLWKGQWDRARPNWGSLMTHMTAVWAALTACWREVKGCFPSRWNGYREWHWHISSCYPAVPTVYVNYIVYF